LLRIFAEGMDGFKGGLSAMNYMKITGAPPTTATNDLGKLVKLGAFTKTGERKGSRYWLNLGGDFEGEKQQHLAAQRINRVSEPLASPHGKTCCGSPS